jgi:hypothetical protein
MIARFRRKDSSRHSCGCAAPKRSWAGAFLSSRSRPRVAGSVPSRRAASIPKCDLAWLRFDRRRHPLLRRADACEILRSTMQCQSMCLVIGCTGPHMTMVFICCWAACRRAFPSALLQETRLAGICTARALRASRVRGSPMPRRPSWQPEQLNFSISTVAMVSFNRATDPPTCSSTSQRFNALGTPVLRRARKYPSK